MTDTRCAPHHVGAPPACVLNTPPWIAIDAPEEAPIREVLAETGLEARYLNLEVTEGTVVREPERVVLLIIGSLTEVSPATYDAVASISPLAASLMFYKMRAVLWVMAVLSHWTVIHRVYHTRDELHRADAARAEAAGAAGDEDARAGSSGREVLTASRLPRP